MQDRLLPDSSNLAITLANPLANLKDKTMAIIRRQSLTESDMRNGGEVPELATQRCALRV